MFVVVVNDCNARRTALTANEANLSICSELLLWFDVCYVGAAAESLLVASSLAAAYHIMAVSY